MRRSGFSLVELMIVVAIIGILSAIAIPLWNEAQLKAKRGEAKTMLQGIAQAEVAYYVANDVWIEADGNPGAAAGSLGKNLRDWDPEMAGWSDLDFHPDGQLRCNYEVFCFGGDDCSGWARTDATCDVDNDNSTATIRYYIPNEGTTGSSDSENGYFHDVYPTRY